MSKIANVLFPIVMVVGFLVSGFVVVSAAQTQNVAPIKMVSQSEAMPHPQTQIEQGEALFVAKGCIVCHRHDAFAAERRAIEFQFDDAPNLTAVRIAPEYLRRWLKDPDDMKPGTYMPNLELKETEIEALVAFLTQSKVGN